MFLGVNGLLAERWIGRVHAAAEAGGPDEVERLVRAALLTIMVVVTIAIIFVIVVKPTLF